MTWQRMFAALLGVEQSARPASSDEVRFIASADVFCLRCIENSLFQGAEALVLKYALLSSRVTGRTS
jgi:hypothetical protein